jgi:hypothetical protein
VTGAASVNTSGTIANHLVLLGATGQPADVARWMPDEWAPPSLADAELVGCAQDAVRTAVETCAYIGSDITRYEVSRSFTVVEAVTAKTLAAFSIVAEPRACHQTEDADLTEIEGRIDSENVADHLRGLVENGRFVDPDSSGPTTEPGKTTEPSPNARAVELRQALLDGSVSISGTGDGLQSLDIELTSQVDYDLDVSIDVGTQLEPSARGTQRMVVVKAQTVSVGAGERASATLDVACMEMHQDQPTADDTFRVLDDPATADLYRLLATPDFTDLSGRVQQFAVWTITNNPKRNDFVGLRSGFDVFGSGPDDDEIAAIREIFETAGIDTSKYRALK